MVIVNYLHFIVYVVLSVILCGAITELIVKSYFFGPLRKFFFVRKDNNFIYDKVSYLLECGYCFSVWSAMFSWACISYLNYSDFYIRESVLENAMITFIIGLIVHRLSNVWHYIVDKLRDF